MGVPRCFPIHAGFGDRRALDCRGEHAFHSARTGQVVERTGTVKGAIGTDQPVGNGLIPMTFVQDLHHLPEGPVDPVVVELKGAIDLFEPVSTEVDQVGAVG